MIIKTSYLLLFLAAFNTAFAERVLPVEDFVRQVYVSGIPYDEAKAYGAHETKILFNMLNDVNEERYWPNIIVMIEIIGGEPDVSKVIDFINESSVGEFSDSRYQAKRAAIFGLGYMINNLKSEQALNFLEKGLAPQNWSDIRGVSKRYPEVDDRNRDLSKHAILGLALSGTDEAISVLERFEESSVLETEYGANMKDLVVQAISEGKKVKAKGMADYQAHKH